jgi:hypothetical protein
LLPEQEGQRRQILYRCHQQADVKEGRHGHGQGEEQGSNPARSFHQTKDPSDFGDADNLPSVLENGPFFVADDEAK